MSIILTIFDEQLFIVTPTSIMGWGGLVAWLAVIIYLINAWKSLHKPLTKKKRNLFTGLFILAPVTSFFIGMRLPVDSILPLPDVTIPIESFAIMLISAIPWVLAAGLFGPLPATILASISGMILASWGTHSLYTVVEMAFLAVLLSGFVNQNYRTWVYRGLRNPVIATLVLCILYPILFLINLILFSSGSFTGQFVFATTNIVSAMITVGGPLLIAGFVVSIVKIANPTQWGGQPPWHLAPKENSLEARFLRSIFPISLVLVLILMAGDWVIAANAARRILESRLASVAQTAAGGVPSLLETGQSLVLGLANEIDTDLYTSPELDLILENEISSMPFFRNLYVLDRELLPITGYPEKNFYAMAISSLESGGLDQAISGVPLQTYTIQPVEGETAGEISFIAAIKNEEEVVQGILIGRVDIETNPFSKPIITNLASLDDVGGVGFLTNDNGHILYHPDHSKLGSIFQLRSEREGGYFEDTTTDGIRQIAYVQRTAGLPWNVVTTVPTAEVQKLTLNTAAPLLCMVILLSLVAVLLIHVGLKSVTASLKLLAVETDRIAQGQLDHPLQIDGDDEVGVLRRSCEKMRVSLKDRLDKLNRLLVVSQGVATSLEMKDAVKPILESALAGGASSARIVLTQAVTQQPSGKSKMPSRFGLGKLTKTYSRFDDQLLVIMAEQDRIVLSNPSRTTLLSVQPGVTRPESLVSIALHHEGKYYGTLWVAYETPHPFTREEVRFLTTLAGQAALAAANTRLFWSAEYGRQRLAAILSSTPDPVIVTDQKNRLLFANPVALQALGLSAEALKGVEIDDLIPKKGLVNLLKSPLDRPDSIEISLPDNRIYTATASPILAEDHRIGKVCMLRDVTQYKKLDDLKSEFVATVSHDLRSPLTLIRGYVTMLDMVGKLNEQQENYVRKIIAGVETMSRLINNLLDLGRIEANNGLKLEKITVGEILDQVTEGFKLKATQKQISLNIDVSEITDPNFEADRSMLEQAFHNLLENAIKYTPSGNEILVRAFPQKEHIIFEFRDTGIGISSVDIPRLFEKFYRSTNRDAKSQSGTGLGLAIVKSVAERHKGKVWIESKLGKGSSFFFEVPTSQRNQTKENQ